MAYVITIDDTGESATITTHNTLRAEGLHYTRQLFQGLKIGEPVDTRERSNVVSSFIRKDYPAWRELVAKCEELNFTAEDRACTISKSMRVEDLIAMLQTLPADSRVAITQYGSDADSHMAYFHDTPVKILHGTNSGETDVYAIGESDQSM